MKRLRGATSISKHNLSGGENPADLPVENHETPYVAESGEGDVVNGDDNTWLVSAAATPWLAAAAAEQASTSLFRRLRKHLSPERAALVVEQAELRSRAEAKFRYAQAMFFSRKALEQSTDEVTARFKARRLNGQLANVGMVADLCCGIGGDTLALAEACEQVVGVEREPSLATLAAANVTVNNYANAAVRLLDVVDFPMEEVAAWHIDPDRRSAGRRTAQFEFGSPTVDEMNQLVNRNPNGSIKLAPAAELDDAWSERGDRQWIGDRRSCRQQVLWMGELARRNGAGRSAVVLADDACHEFQGEADIEFDAAFQVGRYLFEPYPPVFAAGLQNALAGSIGAAGLASGVGYFTCDEPIDSPFGACFEVIAAMPYRLKRIAAELRDRKIGRIEVKKRGVDVNPAVLQKQLKNKADGQGTVIIAPLGGKIIALLTRRCKV